MSESFIQSKIDNYVMNLKTTGAIDKNFQIWDVLGNYVWPNYFVGQTYDEEVVYLKTWINDRLLWMDGAIQNL